MANKRGKEVLELLQEKMSAVFCSLSWVTRKVNTSQSVDSPLRILMNFVVTSIMIISSCILNVPSVSSGRIFFFFLFFKIPFQEQGNEKTNNGTHYKLQLLYSNGECPSLAPSGGYAVRQGLAVGAVISKIHQNSLHEASSVQGWALEFTWAWETELPGMLRVSNKALNGFVLMLSGQDACRT